MPRVGKTSLKQQSRAIKRKAMKTARSDVQSVLIPKTFTKAHAEKWLRDHNFLVSPVDETAEYYRYRQFDPKGAKQHRTISSKDGIKFVIEF